MMLHARCHRAGTRPLTPPQNRPAPPACRRLALARPRRPERARHSAGAQIELVRSPEDEPAPGPGGEAPSAAAEGAPAASASVQLPLPRRSRQVSFTCNKCEGRTTRLVNPIAWDKGLVFLQCATCQVWHNLRDNKGLVEEIRFKDGEEVARSIGNDVLLREQ